MLKHGWRETYIMPLELFFAIALKNVINLGSRQNLIVCEDHFVQSAWIGNDLGDPFANIPGVSNCTWKAAI